MNQIYNKTKYVPLFIATLFGTVVLNCSNSKDSTSGETGKSYSFTANASASFKLNSTKLSGALSAPQQPLALSSGPALCTSVVCFTPTALTGKFYGTGFLIQSNGNGMVAYFGQDSWSNITSSSTSYDFSTTTPVTNTGTLYCCGGTGNLSSENTYIESAMYLFSYLDATFTVSGVTGNTSMNREFTVRFVLADGAITDGKRGDLLLKDPSDSTFKWIDKGTSAGGIVGDGTLVTTRPAQPVTMNTSVKDWTNPFGSDKGNQQIPVLYAPILPESGTGVYQVTEAQLSTVGRTYTYAFDPTNFIMFPELLTTDKDMLYSYTQLLSKIHLGGLPHSAQPNGVGNPAGTYLIVKEP